MQRDIPHRLRPFQKVPPERRQPHPLQGQQKPDWNAQVRLDQQPSRNPTKQKGRSIKHHLYADLLFEGQPPLAEPQARWKPR